MNIIEKISQELQIKTSQTEAVIRLIDAGNTIPFISRYRKEATGGLDDQLLRFSDRLKSRESWMMPCERTLKRQKRW